MYPRWIDIEQAVDVSLGLAGNSNDRVSHFQRRLLNPKRKVISAGELLAFPWPKRLQGMHCDDERDPVILFRENPAEMGVPRMAVHDICVDVRCVEISAASHCAEC